MKRSRLLIASGYWLAGLLVIMPLLHPVVSLLPLRPGLVAWRLQAFGALSLALVLPVLGAVVALATAVLLGHRTVVRVLAVLDLLAGLTLTVVAGLFSLDLLQYSGAIDSTLREYYRVAGVVYLVAFAFSAAFLLWLGAVAWRAARKSPRRWRHRTRPEPASTLHPTRSVEPVS